MAQRNADGSVTVRTAGALAYNPTVNGSTAAFRGPLARKIGGGGFAQSGRLTRQAGRTYAPSSARG